MQDPTELEGLWRVVRNHRGTCELRHHASHFQFTGNRVEEIDPSQVDEGTFRMTFQIQREFEPPRMNIHMEWTDFEPPRTWDSVWTYRLSGNTLQITEGVLQEGQIAYDESQRIVTLERDFGPPPERRQPSGTPPLVDDVLGSLNWRDNFNWYKGPVSSGGMTFDVSIDPNREGSIETARNRARGVVQQIRQNLQRAKLAALKGLFDTWFDVWRPESAEEDLDEEPDDALVESAKQEFLDRLSLQSLSFRPEGSVTYWFDDGDLFLGHTVRVEFGPDDKVTNVDI